MPVSPSARNDYFSDLSREAIRAQPDEVRSQLNPRTLEDLFRRVARDTMQDAITMMKGAGVGDMQRDPLTQEPLPETKEQAYVRKVQNQLKDQIVANMANGIKKLGA